ncbi:uncharacterized protein [Panulirus ornatus]|uniref:uncharacterized protein n=1 Tax=Panulirus ornatus TaxID=150431 RepID=UPI003A86D562
MPEGGVCVMVWQLLALVVVVTTTPGLCHVVWTPILPASQDQVDLWTVSGTGCSCPRQPPGRPHDCACCVSRIACPCGQANPHRCAQCGLQQHCSNMCNMTIDGRLLSVTSGRLSGSLVSPGEMVAPTSCWYQLRAPPDHRVELQIHRLVHVGSFINATTCRGGFVEVSDGRSRSDGIAEGGLTGLRICGEDERLHPPVVLYSDTGSATITYQVNERWGSPRFIAYYNFPHKTNPDTGDRQRGGTRLDYTACDWLYQDVHCAQAGKCQLTSPGFPGMYPAHVRCRYLLVMSSPDTAGTLTFHTMDLHPERCSTDFLAVYAGTSTSTPLIDSLCASDARTISFSGPSVLLDFSSGPHLPPYRFSGFHATVDFTGVVGVPQPSSALSPTSPPHPNTLSDPTGGSGEDECHKVFWSNRTREGIFDTSAISPGGQVCCLRFMGHQDEVIQVSLFKYKLGGRSCASEASIYDGLLGDGGDNLLRRLCGPLSREPRDASGRFLQQEFFLSSSNSMEIRLRLGPATNFHNQFLVGGYHFHNSRLEGTKKPTSVCDVMFYGASSPGQGLVHNPTTTLLWNVEGSLNCSYLFVPTSTQSLSLTVQEGSKTATEAHCSSQCGEEGCQCRPSMVPLQHVDHLLFLHTPTHRVIACLCGHMKDIRPLLVETGGGVDVIYHVAHFTWTTPGFNFTLGYSFFPASVCGPTYHTTLAGEVGPRGYTAPATTYLYVTCTWVISSQPASALAITVTPPKQGSCNTWNLSVASMGRDTGQVPLGGACASQDTLLYHVPVDHLSASLTLEMRGPRRPDWLISWNTHWPQHLPPTTSISPKPEHSRTVNAHPTRKTHKVQSGGWSFRRSVSGIHHRLVQVAAALAVVALQLAVHR